MFALRLSSTLAVSLAAALGALPARAVVVAGGDGTQNTTAPADDFGFGNVARVFNTTDGFFNSGVYLGHGFVLSAYHPVRDGGGGFRFGPVIFRDPTGVDVSFDVNPATAVRLKNADNTFTDLSVFQLTAEPTFLPEVVLAQSTPLGGTSVRLAGNGVNRLPNETHWDTSTNPWTETAGTGNRQGYKWVLGAQTLRWGTNTLDSNVLPINRTFSVNGGFGMVTSVRTDFDNASGEAQGVVGDSGGGVFYKNGSQWELLGIMHSVGFADGQPGETSAFSLNAPQDNYTYAADIPTYRQQILSVVPEPSSGMLVLAGAVALGTRRRQGR